MEKPLELQKLLRNQTNPTIAVTDTELIGPNTRRVALIVSAPAPFDTSSIDEGTFTNAVSTASTGVKSSYVVPAGVQAVLESATFFALAGAAVVAALQLVRGGNTVTLASFTTSGVWTGFVPLQAGDTVQWNVTTLIAASTSDFTINVTRERVPVRVSLSFQGPAILDNGINLYAGNSPLVLLYHHIGQAIREEVRAISSNGSQVISVVDVFAESP